MSHVLSPPTPIASLRRSAARIWSDPDSRSILIGLLAVLLVHLFLFAVGPYLLRTDTLSASAHKLAVPKQFNIEISPEEFVKPLPKPPPPNRYVEANPNAPDNVPDKTNNFSSQNSQLAQEKPQADQHNDKPKLDGKKDIESDQVVSGQLTKPQDSVPVPKEVAKPAKTETAARQKQDPLAGYEKMPNGADDGFASNLGKNPNVAKPADQKLDGVNNAPNVANATSTQPVIDPTHPQPRPTLEQVHTRPAVFQDNQFGTSNMGAIAYDAKWSNYGAYLHKMLEAIQLQWERILIDSQTEPPSGSYVTVKFTMDSHGRITEILDVENTSSEQGKQSCLSAITLTAPYGEWTDDMIAVLGNSQELTFRFYYE
jgi:hypothetical protein